MTLKSGSAYEGRAIKELAEWGIFATGLQPNSSPDLILPKSMIGIEVKSTKQNKFYPSKNPEQYEYLKNQFPDDFPGWSSYYMVYFLKYHHWEIFPVASKSPFKAGEGLTLYYFISQVVLPHVMVGNEILNQGVKQ